MMANCNWFFLVSSLVLPSSVDMVYTPGSDDIRTFLLCHPNTDDLQCEVGKFIWISELWMSYSPSYVPNDPDTCQINENDCRAAYSGDGAIYRATSYQYFGGVTVPRIAIPCEDSLEVVNYLYIRYSCIDEVQMDPINFCSDTTVSITEGHLTNPSWPLSVPAFHTDCTCYIRPAASDETHMRVEFAFMYVALPEVVPCGEKTWMEDQDGNVLLSFCSPGWDVYVTRVFSGNSLTMRFFKNYTNVYTNPNLFTKVWYGLEANTTMNVTCGLTSEVSPTSSMGEQSTDPNGENTVDPDVENTSGLEDSTVLMMSIIIGVVVILVALIITIAVVVVVRSRGKHNDSPQATGNSNSGFDHPDPPCDDGYETVDYSDMARTQGSRYVDPPPAYESIRGVPKTMPDIYLSALSNQPHGPTATPTMQNAI